MAVTLEPERCVDALCLVPQIMPPIMFKYRKFWNRGMKFDNPNMPRYKFPPPARLVLNRAKKREYIEEKMADGVAFVPEPLLPPWKRRFARPDVSNSVVRMNGFRIRPATNDGLTGFPTHHL